MTSPTIVEYSTEKWGGLPHYRSDMVLLGEDELGLWLWGPLGRTIYRADEPIFTTEYEVVTVVPRDRWWAAAWWLGHPELELYVNINTPAEITAGRIVATDLDLDVIRRVDGTSDIVDRDEFELHRVHYAYPDDIAAAAEAATDEALERVVARTPPFDGHAARRWTQRARGG